MKSKKILISVGLSLLLVACGSSNSHNDNKISVPQKIDVAVPKVLQSHSKSKNKISEKELAVDPLEEANSYDEPIGTSRGYRQLKDEIANAKMMQIDLQVNLLLAERIMPQIQERCDSVALEESCEIEPNAISFVLDESMKRDIAKITGEALTEDYSNSRGAQEDRTFHLGAVSFRQQKSSADYQYLLTMDMSSFDNSGGGNNRSIQTIKWSKDENRVWSIRHFNSSDASTNLSIRYLKKENGETQMELDDNYEGSITTSSVSSSSVAVSVDGSQPSEIISLADDTPTVEQASSEFHFKISNLNDYFKISSNSQDIINNTNMGNMSSIGEISNQGGYLNFKGTFQENTYREKEQFDANGDIISSRYCNDTEACDLNDESTWLEHGDKDIEIPFNSEMVSLNVTGGKLKEGQYLLLAPSTDRDTLSVEEVFDASVGELYVSEGSSHGSLNDKSHLAQLDSLIIVYVDYTLDENSPLKAPTFEVLSVENRPILTAE